MRWCRLACSILLALPLAVAMPGPPVASARPASDCGAPTYKKDGSAWRCTFVDGFDGSSLNAANWSPLTTKATNLGIPHCFVDSPNNLSVGDGLLHLTIRKEPSPFFCEMIVGGFASRYTAGGVTSWAKFNQTYGRFETRAAFPATKEPGVYGAIWMWSQSNRGKYGADSGGAGATRCGRSPIGRQRCPPQHDPRPGLGAARRASARRPRVPPRLPIPAPAWPTFPPLWAVRAPPRHTRREPTWPPL